MRVTFQCVCTCVFMSSLYGADICAGQQGLSCQTLLDIMSEPWGALLPGATLERKEGSLSFDSAFDTSPPSIGVTQGW